MKAPSPIRRPIRRPTGLRPPATQRGAALLTAMVIVTLIATLTVGMVWQQWRAVQVEAAERVQVQARWTLDGALDWARLILREDRRDYDHPSEVWALELKEARLSSFLAADRNNTDDGPEAFLSGSIRDAQARYNLTNLKLRAKMIDGRLVDREADSLARLCELIGSNRQVAQRLTQAVRLAYPPPSTEGGATTAGTAVVSTATPGQNAPIIPEQVAQLGWLGLDAATVALLEPHLVILSSPTPVNLNTASREVIAAVAGIDLSAAQRLVQQRTSAPLTTLESAQTALGLKELDPARFSINSNYFEVYGNARLDKLIVTQRSLLWRGAGPRSDVKVLRTDRVQPRRDPAIALQQ